MSYYKILFFILLSLVMRSIEADENKSFALPDPLTLDYVLSLSANDHPDNVVARSRLQGAQAFKDGVDGRQGLQTRLQGRLRWVEPADRALYPDREDHSIALSASKRLYDFGRSSADSASAEAQVNARKWLLEDQQLQHRIDVMEAFFNVILADLAYARDNELMAIAYVRFDRIKDRNELGQVADVDLLEAENTYFKSRSVRYASDVARRSSRSRLANLLNLPGELPANLVRPKLKVLDREVPDIEELQQQVLKSNAGLLSLRQQVESARQKVLAARARNKPIIDLELQAADYSRNLRSSDRFQGGFVFEMPLSTSGAIDADIAEQRALLIETRALLRKAEMDVQQDILDAWQRLTVLKAQREEAAVFSEYRDAALDKDRGLYELDVAADLGDSLALYSAALYQSAKADYDYALAWERMNLLLGQQVVSTNDNTSEVTK